MSEDDPEGEKPTSPAPTAAEKAAEAERTAEVSGSAEKRPLDSPAVAAAVCPPVICECDPGAELSANDSSQAASAADEPSVGSSPALTEERSGRTEKATGQGAHVGQPHHAVAAPRRRFRWGRLLLVILFIAILWPPVSVLVTKVVLPPATFLMIERLFEGRGLEKHWRPLDRIAPSLATAVIAAEDARFCEHDGFDWNAIRIAAEHNARSHAKVRGGSTLSQQTAKNVFLWPARDYVRKGLEAGYTVLIEKLWGKRRILEAYLNVVEWGPGVYGAQAAAQRYFHEDASALSPQQSARLAAILPSPLKWKAVNPGRYVASRSRRIGANAVIVRADDLAWCVRR